MQTICSQSTSTYFDNKNHVSRTFQLSTKHFYISALQASKNNLQVNREPNFNHAIGREYNILVYKHNTVKNKKSERYTVSHIVTKIYTWHTCYVKQHILPGWLEGPKSACNIWKLSQMCAPLSRAARGPTAQAPCPCTLATWRTRRAHQLLSAEFKQVQQPFFSLFNFPSRRNGSKKGQGRMMSGFCSAKKGLY